MLWTPRQPLISCGFLSPEAGACSGVGKSSTPTLLSSLRPHRAPVNPELLRDRLDAHAALARCSHSVHFAVRESCSRLFTWFRRRTDQSVVNLASSVCIASIPLIPSGNQLLNPRLPIPATLHCFHWKVVVQTGDSTGVRPRLSAPSFVAAAIVCAPGSKNALNDSPGSPMTVPSSLR